VFFSSGMGGGEDICTMGMLVPSFSFRFGIGVWMLAIVVDFSGGGSVGVVVDGSGQWCVCIWLMKSENNAQVAL
jgi:hypothetical protein